MKIALISGSHRANSESGRVADYLAGRLAANHGVEAGVLKLEGNPLPLWDESAWQAGSDLAKKFAPYAEQLKAADGFVITVPEWAGMAAAGIKNFMLYTNQFMVGHKPALLAAVSASRGGSYPIAEMLMSSYKNNKICYLPEHLIFQNVGDLLKGATPANDADAYIRGRADFALNILVRYAGALKDVRAAGDVFHEKYPYGM